MLAFVHVQRGGGTTLKWILRSTFGLRHLDVEPWHERFTTDPITADDLRRVFRFFPYLRSLHGHRLVPYADLEDVCSNIRYFSFVREPLSQCASWFQYLVQVRGRKDLVFEEYIQTDFPRNRQTQLLVGSADVDAAIRIIHQKNVFVGLVEHFDESVLMLKALVAPELNIGYRRRNAAADNALARGLLSTERTRQMIVEATRADVRLYDYVKRELYPTYQQAYGASLQADLEGYRSARGTFNHPNVTLSRMQLYLLYKPLLYLYRRGINI